MTISELIAELQVLRAQHGDDLEVWVRGGVSHPELKVEQYVDRLPTDEGGKVLMIG